MGNPLGIFDKSLLSEVNNGGRPDHFTVEVPTFSPKLMVFCGIKRDGTFGLFWAFFLPQKSGFLPENPFFSYGIVFFWHRGVRTPRRGARFDTFGSIVRLFVSELRPFS